LYAYFEEGGVHRASRTITGEIRLEIMFEVGVEIKSAIVMTMGLPAAKDWVSKLNQFLN
jgi:hypothetical protein